MCQNLLPPLVSADIQCLPVPPPTSHIPGTVPFLGRTNREVKSEVKINSQERTDSENPARCRYAGPRVSRTDAGVRPLRRLCGVAGS